MSMTGQIRVLCIGGEKLIGDLCVCACGHSDKGLVKIPLLLHLGLYVYNVTRQRCSIKQDEQLNFVVPISSYLSSHRFLPTVGLLPSLS